MMSQIVLSQHRAAMTTSMIVADSFDKRHDRVLESIRGIIPDLPKGSAPFYREANYIDEQGKPRPMYEMTRDGFSLLAMGFNGRKALGFKLKFLDAFNKMERALLQRENLSWQEQRLDNKSGRHSETDSIARFVEYATAQGSQHAKLYYINITKMTYHSLNIAKQIGPPSLRDSLDAIHLSFLTTAEHIIRQVLEDGMNDGLHYKDVYQMARGKVLSFAGALPYQRQISA